MSQYIQVVPAYGRDYKSRKAVLLDWNANKDFRIADLMNPDYGRYINKSQVTADMMIMVRYDQCRKVTCVT